MSDDEPDRPLTRRERRLREMAESGLSPTVAGAGNRAGAEASTDAAEAGTRESAEKQQPERPDEAARSSDATAETPAGGEDEIAISPYNEDGTPRTRREIRALREQALAARRPTRPDQEAERAPEEPVAPPQAAHEEFDPRLADTQPFSPGDLEEVVAAERVPPGEDDDAVTEPVRADELEGADPLPAVREEPEGGVYDPNHGSHLAGPAVEEGVEPEGVTEAVEQRPADSDEGDAEDDESQAKTGYSFPDIAPLDDNVSVFDHHSPTTSDPEEAAASEGSGDFDDLISRAVAQEGSPHSTNTSALILPTLPDGSGLSGPLGETGELFVTGSIEMPKSIGETGGRPALQESHDLDPLDELGFDALHATGDPIEPVSAKRAVSTTGAHSPIVANQATEKSRLPLVLILTGGALLIAVAGLVAWGVSSGMFG